MAGGTKNDFVIYNEQFYGGMTEVVEQNSNAFNAASRGGIRLVPTRLKGDYAQESFNQLIDGLIARRDVTSISGVDDKKMTQGELISVKLNRRIGPVTQTLDAFRKIDQDPAVMSFILGQQIGPALVEEMLNSGLAAGNAALTGVPALNHDGSAGTVDATKLTYAMQKLGDRHGRIACWVMHSKVYFDLMRSYISEKIFEVTGVIVYGGSVATFGIPVVVTDSPSLFDAGATSSLGDDRYSVLGLTSDAVVVEESEERSIVTDLVTGQENLSYRLQGEYGYNLSVKGFKWDTVNGGINPSNSAIATSTNWDKAYTDTKSLAGVRLLVK